MTEVREIRQEVVDQAWMEVGELTASFDDRNVTYGFGELDTRPFAACASGSWRPPRVSAE